MKAKYHRTFITTILIIHFTSCLYAQIWTEVNPELGRVSDFTEFDGTLYSISNLGLFAYSTDNGTTWTTKNIYGSATLEGATFTSMTFFDSDHGIIGIRNYLTGNQLLQTFDGGENWEVIPAVYDANCSSGFIPIGLDLVSDSTVILDLHLSGTYYLTHNRGLNWSCNSPFTGSDVFQVTTVRSVSEWLSNGDDGLYKTEDAGENWTRITEKGFVHYQEINNGTILGLTRDYNEPTNTPVLYKSTNEFLTYDSIILNQFEDKYINLFLAVSEEELYMLLSGDEIYYSNDGGQSFEFTQVLSSEPFRSSQINGDWYLFGRGLWKLNQNVSNVVDAFCPEQIKIFPNPTTNTVYIADYVLDSYELFSIDGKLIQSGAIENFQINLRPQERGQYFLKLKKGDSFCVKKVIKW